jgi:hypothetical protein
MPPTRQHGIGFRLALGWRTPTARPADDRHIYGVLAINLVVNRRRVVTPAAGVL